MLFDAVVCPGGMGGVQNLIESPIVGKILKNHQVSGMVVSAICAAPMCLAAHKVGEGRTVTCYPALKKTIEDYGHFKNVTTGNDVEIDGNFLTSRGPGTAMKFAVQLVALLRGQSIADKLANDLLLN
ncbi:protein dj-1beta-like [Octopus sinensis]|uniref:Protein dj-1beta-like n=1 Tax=Octopus sinensis TaxID=2607531 RepID=A0A6P7U2E0_9MOLL|nr:protein dj-1beta-like [Octopus sinensis]